MKNIFLIFCLVTINSVFAQQFTADSLKGEWVCKEAVVTETITDAQMKQITAMLKKGFVNSRFIFREDEIVNFYLPKDAPAKMKDLVFLDNKKWRYDSEIGLISIDPQIMEIKVTKGDGFLTFQLEEIPLSLKMVLRIRYPEARGLV